MEKATDEMCFFKWATSAYFNSYSEHFKIALDKSLSPTVRVTLFFLYKTQNLSASPMLNPPKKTEKKGKIG